MTGLADKYLYDPNSPLRNEDSTSLCSKSR